MLNQEFCTSLEDGILKALPYANNIQARHFWCDGVLPPISEHMYSKKVVNDHRQIVMTAFIGPDGQDRYELTLKFGSKALRSYVRDADMTACIPDAGTGNFLEIDIERKQISVQLY